MAGADVLAVKLLLVSLAIPFVVCIIAYVQMRFTSDDWLPEGVAGLPKVLWISTAAILCVSLCAHAAVHSVREDLEQETRWALLGTLFFAAVFTVSQTAAWYEMRGAFLDLEEDLRRYKATFYLLTGFHVLHVLGGVGIQAYVLVQHQRRRYWSLHHPGIQHVAWYWHFVDVVWMAVFLTLLIGS